MALDLQIHQLQCEKINIKIYYKILGVFTCKSWQSFKTPWVNTSVSDQTSTTTDTIHLLMQVIGHRYQDEGRLHTTGYDHIYIYMCVNICESGLYTHMHIEKQIVFTPHGEVDPEEECGHQQPTYTPLTPHSCSRHPSPPQTLSHVDPKQSVVYP